MESTYGLSELEQEVIQAISQNEDRFKELLEHILYQYYSEGNHRDYDEDGAYFSAPDENKTIREVATNIMENLSDFEGFEKFFVNDEISEETNNLIEIYLKKALSNLFNDAEQEARETASETASYAKDPYGYYGVKRSDFA